MLKQENDCEFSSGSKIQLAWWRGVVKSITNQRCTPIKEDDSLEVGGHVHLPRQPQQHGI